MIAANPTLACINPKCRSLRLSAFAAYSIIE